MKKSSGLREAVRTRIGAGRLIAWFLARSAVAAVLIAAGRAIDQVAQFPAFPQGRGLAALAILPGVLILLRSVRELIAAGPGRLTESGPYHVLRHPMEIGAQLVLVGAALATASLGSLLTAGPLAFLLWAGHALLVEEPAMCRRLGRPYLLYRGSTGLLLPSLYVWSVGMVRAFYRLWCGVQIRGERQVPRSGPLFLVGLHRCHMDPYFMTFAAGRKVHFIATAVLFRHFIGSWYFRRMGCIPLVRSRADLRPLMSAFEILDQGGVVGMFPEGARSWYGETACEPAVFKVLEKREVPVVSVEISGAFEHQPRFTRRPRPSPIRVRYRAHAPGSKSARQIIEELVQGERLRDAQLRLRQRPQPARVAEQLVYVCPQCGVPFRCRGFDDGRLVCRACGTPFTLLEGKGLRGPRGILSLTELQTRAVAWSRSFEPDGLAIPVSLVRRFRMKPGVHLQSSRWLRKRDMHGLHPGSLRLYTDRLTVGNRESLDISYQELDSVLVENNWKVEFSYRKPGGERGYVLCIPPLVYPVFLQHFLRIRAFGSPDVRYRGSARSEIRVPGTDLAPPGQP
jgi:1-acyl-sn-glycerol-3-phosphate acyltransferase